MSSLPESPISLGEGEKDSLGRFGAAGPEFSKLGAAKGNESLAGSAISKERWNVDEGLQLAGRESVGMRGGCRRSIRYQGDLIEQQDR